MTNQVSNKHRVAADHADNQVLTYTPDVPVWKVCSRCVVRSSRPSGLLRDAALRRMPGVHDAAALRAAAAIARSRSAGAARIVACRTAPAVAYTISECWLAPKSHRRAASPIAAFRKAPVA